MIHPYAILVLLILSVFLLFTASLWVLCITILLTILYGHYRAIDVERG